MGPDGKPNFNLLQNFKSAESHITYYAFDVLRHKGRDLTQVPLSERRALLRTVLKPSDHVALSEVSDRTAAEMLKFVKSHGLEGVVAKRTLHKIGCPISRFREVGIRESDPLPPISIAETNSMAPVARRWSRKMPESSLPVRSLAP
jgi:hypothetical protein